MQRIIKAICKAVGTVEKMSKYVFSLYIFKKNKTFNIHNSFETIEYIISNHASVSRFGDGEFKIMMGEGIGFQDADIPLAKRLNEILNSSGKNFKHIVCIPYPLESLHGLKKRSRNFWLKFISDNYRPLLKMIPLHVIFYDANFTRFYMDFQEINNCRKKIDEIKRIWNKREVVIVEGTGTRMGVNNDLFNNVKSLRRIICPSRNAFNVYNHIFTYICNNIEKEALVLCALGMTATVLAFDLYNVGYQAIDIGHIDIEYEWFLMNAKEKSPVVGKSVNECGINNPDEVDSVIYREQIIYTIDINT